MDLEPLADRLAPDFAHVGLAAWSAGRARYACRSASGLRAVGPDAPMRVASISKIVTGQLALEASSGDDTVLDEVFCRSLRPDRVPVRLRDVLSHTSGLSDGGPVAPDLSSVGILDGLDWSTSVGERFEYSNTGYILAALAAEQVTGRAFADRSTAWMTAHGLEGGFNWAGVRPDRRADAVPVYRRDGGRLIAQIDADVPSDGVVWADGTVLSDPPTAVGLSPQGGLRLSLSGALGLARLIPDLDRRVLHDPGPPQETDLYDQYGAGLMILRRPTFYPRPLVGHFANAYGLCGGVWWDAQAEIAFAYLLNGLPLGDEDDRLRPAECAIFSAVAELA